jgi:predicted RNase H-like HicB family nuclease
MELTVVVHREPDGFWSEVDELPGCFASGRTLGELTEALGEAVGLYLGDEPVVLGGEPLEVGRVKVALDQPPDPS